MVKTDDTIAVRISKGFQWDCRGFEGSHLYQWQQDADLNTTNTALARVSVTGSSVTRELSTGRFEQPGHLFSFGGLYSQWARLTRDRVISVGNPDWRGTGTLRGMFRVTAGRGPSSV